MATNEDREEAAVIADPDATAYEPLIIPYPVWPAIHECGVKRDDHMTVSSGLFHDDFETCINLDKAELNKYFKTMTSNANKKEGKISFTIDERCAMIAFVQWTKDKIRCGKDPAMYQFENTGISALIKRAKTHERYVTNASSNDAKPKDFTKDLKCADWSPGF